MAVKIFSKPCYGLLTVSIEGKADITYCYNSYEIRSQVVAIIQRRQGYQYHIIQPSETRVYNDVAERMTKELLEKELLKSA